MLIPVGLEGEIVRRTPWITFGLLVLTILISMAVWIGDVPLDRVGFVPAHPEPARDAVSAFVHADVAHLAGNMLFLYATGPFVENAYGRILFPVLYFVSAGVANRVYASHDPESLIPVVGASGAIAGIMGAFLIRFGRRNLRFLWMPFFPLPWMRGEFSLPAFLFLPVWFGAQLLLAQVAPSGSGVAYWAHVGGFGLGVVAALAIAVLGIERKLIHPAVASRIGEGLRSGGRLGGASAGKDEADVERAYRDCLISGDGRGLAEQAEALLDLYIQRGDRVSARRVIAEATGSALSDLPARFLWRAGEFYAGQGNHSQALALYRSLEAAHPGDPAALRALLKIVTIAKAVGDENGAASALARARGHPGFTQEWARAFKAASSEHRATRPPPR